MRRRTIYRFIVRSVPNPFMEALDCADPNLNTPVRSQTLTALQALALWNDLFMVRQSQEFAHRLEQETGDRRARIVARLSARARPRTRSIRARSPGRLRSQARPGARLPLALEHQRVRLRRLIYDTLASLRRDLTAAMAHPAIPAPSRIKPDGSGTA